MKEEFSQSYIQNAKRGTGQQGKQKLPSFPTIQFKLSELCLSQIQIEYGPF